MKKTTRCIPFLFILLLLTVPPVDATDGNSKKIGLVMKALTNPFFLKMKSGAEEYADKHHIHLEVFGVERETEINRQISIVENLISRDYGAIVIAPADSKKLIPVCKKAMEKGITVINIDNPFHKESLKASGITIPFVGSDNRTGASMVAEYIKGKMEGKGSAVIIEGIRGVENAELRKEGFLQVLTDGTEITISASESANWHKDEAFSVMTAILQEHQKPDAVLCANDNMALGVIQALEMSGKSDGVWIGAYDNIDEARNEMRNKRMHATIEQHPELMGQYGVELAVRALDGNSVPDYTPIPLDLITFETFDRKIGLSVSDLDNPFFAYLEKGARKTADMFGLKLLVSDAQNDDAEQLIGVQQFVQEKVEVVIINPTNTAAVAPAIDIADTSGIKIISVDRKSSRPDIVISHIASDNVAGGRIAGEFIAKKLKGKGNILEVEGIPGTSAAHDRGQGFNEVIRQYPDMRITENLVADFDRSKAGELVSRIIREGKTFDAVFAHNDLMVLGVADAYKAAGVQPPRVIIGFDATPEALKAVKEGRITATIAQKPETMGAIAIQSAVRLLRGEKPEKEIPVELKLVSGDS